jgi:hypothetical protein
VLNAERGCGAHDAADVERVLDAVEQQGDALLGATLPRAV